jgi:hypothetical protein
MPMSNREKVYREHIMPMLHQIYAMCEEHDIQMLAAFSLDKDAETENIVSSYYNSEDCQSTRINDAAMVVTHGFDVVPPYVKEMAQHISDQLMKHAEEKSKES